MGQANIQEWPTTKLMSLHDPKNPWKKFFEDVEAARERINQDRYRMRREKRKKDATGKT
jgi:hypothetical protein